GDAYSSIGGQAQTRFRSPYGLSMRETGGQYFAVLRLASGQAACSREYGWVHSVAVTSSAGGGARLGALSCASPRPSMPACISARIAIIASQNRSSSSFGSLSVGSTISVPVTGKDTVGA